MAASVVILKYGIILHSRSSALSGILNTMLIGWLLEYWISKRSYLAVNLLTIVRML